jgi:PilZ domain
MVATITWNATGMNSIPQRSAVIACKLVQGEQKANRQADLCAIHDRRHGSLHALRTDLFPVGFWYIRTFPASMDFVSGVLLFAFSVPAKLFLQSGGSALTGSERRNTQRFQMRLPLTVRWTTGAAVGETSTESRDVSSRGVYFFLSKDVKQGSAIEILLTLPNEITLAGPVRVRCLGRVQRTEARDEGAIGVVAAIERYEFLRGDDDRKQ